MKTDDLYAVVYYQNHTAKRTAVRLRLAPRAECERVIKVNGWQIESVCEVTKVMVIVPVDVQI